MENVLEWKKYSNSKQYKAESVVYYFSVRKKMKKIR